MVQPKAGTTPLVVGSKAVPITNPPVDIILLMVAGIWNLIQPKSTLPSCDCHRFGIVNEQILIYAAGKNLVSLSM